MALNPSYREMLGDQLFDAVEAAADRLGNDTVIARCNAGLWLVEVDGEAVAEGLTYEGAVEAANALDIA